MQRIYHPNPTEGEVVASGMTFVNGVAEVEGDLSDAREVLEAHGFRIEQSKRSAGSGSAEAPVPARQKRRFRLGRSER